MRVKVQIKQAGVFQDLYVDPASNNMLALEFTSTDIEYICKRQVKSGSSKRLLLGMMPRRVKTRVMGPAGVPIDMFFDRTAGDWISIELTPHDVLRLAQASPGPDQNMLVNATQPRAKIDRNELTKFVSSWPPVRDPADLYFPSEELQGAPRILNGQEAQIGAFIHWVNNWHPMFHATDRAPEAKLIMPNGAQRD